MAACPPAFSICGQFLCGTQTVSAHLEDATCGVPVCGYATCGMWWAYLCTAGLQLSGVPPDGVLVPPPGTVSVSAAELDLHGVVPSLAISSTVTAPVGALQLVGVAPTLRISTTFVVPAAQLDLGGMTPTFVGELWLHEFDCVDLPLVAAGSSDLALVAAGTTTFDLEPEVCR